VSQQLRPGQESLSDARSTVRNTNVVMPFPSYATREIWEARAESLRRRILVSAGLWPMPERCPLAAHVTGRTVHDDYTIENVYFESWPGFFVTGNLYRPRGKRGPFSAVLSPHGHWHDQGRLVDNEMASVPGRCINLARQGHVALAHDMIGVNDSGLQVDHASDNLRTGSFDDPRGYLWGVSILGLQLWNSIRALDYLESLPDVDAQRLGCTGESGGGTQTFLLTAVDQRVRVAAPVNMISAHFQGGCLCENAPNLRLNASNVEFAALAAPRPLLMISASGDWTRNTPTVEFPAVQSIYRLYGVPDHVATVQINADHNYNRESRDAMYAWFGRWLLNEDDAALLKERPFQAESRAHMLVFPDAKLPPHAVNRVQLTDEVMRAADGQIQSLQPTDAATLQAYRELMGASYRLALNAEQPASGDLQVEMAGIDRYEGYVRERLTIGRRREGERIPTFLFAPEKSKAGVLIVHPRGKAALVRGNVPTALVRRLLAQQMTVLAIDTFGTGDLAGQKRDTTVDHFLTYNRSDDALRVQDILTGLAYLSSRVDAVHLVGLDQAGLWCLLASGLAQGVGQTVVDADQFPYYNDGAWTERLYIPQIRRAADVRSAAALLAPNRLTIHNAAASFPAGWLRRVYDAAGSPAALHIQAERMSGQAIVDRL
jgi:dienelactone hydrolase